MLRAFEGRQDQRCRLPVDCQRIPVRYPSSPVRSARGRSRDVSPMDVRPFTLDVPEADLNDLRERLARTRWPERETVDD